MESEKKLKGSEEMRVDYRRFIYKLRTRNWHGIVINVPRIHPEAALIPRWQYTNTIKKHMLL